jgi:alpha-L-fucosidase 2
MASGWLCQHLWDHYLFNLDRTFLEKRAYPLMKGAAQFYSAWLVEDESGHLTTPVSTSPENGFSYVDSSGQRREAAVSKGTLLDIAIIRELFSNVIEAGKLLGVDSDLRGTLSAQLRRLQEYQVGSSGELLEWFKEFGPIGPRHNTSPFYPLYPGSEITEATPRLWQAVRQLLLSRHRTTGGWPAAWTSCCWARLGDATRAHESYRSILARTSHPNLFNGHDNIFQVDGNLGAVAAVAEMLLQSHAGTLHLLPALPPAWPSGRVKGLRARGGFEVEILWKNGLLTEAVVRASRDAKANLRYRDRTTSLDLHAGQHYKIGADLQVLG